jgi:hypothetical protein
MAWTSPYIYTTGQVLTAANLNTYLSDNTTYLKSQTDLFNLAVYNNGSTTLAVGAPVIFDSAYTSGLGVTQTTSNSDPRTIGVVIGSAISGSASGLIWAPGFMKQTVNVTGAVTFGHTLVSSTVAQYAVDSGGTGILTGMIGWALAASTGGTTSISALMKVNPTVYANAVSIGHSMGSTTSFGSPVTIFTSAVSDGNNRLMVGFGFSNLATYPSTFAFDGHVFTSLQAGSTIATYAAYCLSTANTANVTANYTTNSGIGLEVLLNNVNQSTPVGTLATATASSSLGSVVVNCSPGDFVLGCIAWPSTTVSMGSRGGATAIVSETVNQSMDLAYQYASGATCTFNWTLSGSTTWNACGFAIKTI